MTLIEVLISLTILLIGITSMISVLSNATNIYLNQKDDIIAMMIAQSVMENLLYHYPDHEDLDRGRTHGPIYFNAEGLETLDDYYFRSTWILEDHESIDGLASMTVDVSWSGALQHHRVTSLLTLRPVQ